MKVCKTPDEAREFARGMLGKTLVTHQTGPAGREVRRVLVEQGCDIARELYLGMVIDRGRGWPTLMASAEGGVEIEEVAARSPEKILREPIDPAVGIQAFQARKIAFGLGMPKESVNKAVAFITALYRAFVESDCSMAEINPLVLTKSGDLIALDAKMGFDDNALFRQPDIRELRDLNEEDPQGSRGVEVRPQLHLARRQHRLHGQRRRPGDGDDGHHQALRRRAGELPRRRRRRHHREGHRGLQDHSLRSRT